jgi:hypothetical protein
MTKAKPQTSQPELNLNSSRAIFAVRKTVLLEKLRFFQEVPSLLNRSEYRVKTKVPSAIFGDFVNCVKDKPAQVIEANFIFLRDLSQELASVKHSTNRKQTLMRIQMTNGTQANCTT